MQLVLNVWSIKVLNGVHVRGKCVFFAFYEKGGH